VSMTNLGLDYGHGHMNQELPITGMISIAIWADILHHASLLTRKILCPRISYVPSDVANIRLIC
jgi:hypothetical protein